LFCCQVLGGTIGLKKNGETGFADFSDYTVGNCLTQQIEYMIEWIWCQTLEKVSEISLRPVDNFLTITALWLLPHDYFS